MALSGAALKAGYSYSYRGFPKKNSAGKYFSDRRPSGNANDNVKRPSFDYVTKEYTYSQLATEMALQSLLYLTPYGRGLALLLTLYDLWKLLMEGRGDDPWNHWWNSSGYMKCPEGNCVPPTRWTGGTAVACGLSNPCGNRTGPSNPLPVTGMPQSVIIYGQSPGQGPTTYKVNSFWIKQPGATRAPNYQWASPPVHWPGADETKWPDYRPGHQPRVVPPGYVPGLDPMEKPIQMPEWDYPSKPYTIIPEIKPNEWRSPLEQTWRGPLPPVRPRPLPPVMPRPLVPEIPNLPDTPTQPDIPQQPKPRLDYRIDHRIYDDGSLDTEQSVRQRPARKPPRPRTKERKLRHGGALGVSIRTFANALTEGKDFIDALWKALPKDKRTKPAKGHRTVVLQDKVRDLYNNWLDLDLPRALKNYIENELQDRFYGGVGKLGGKAVRELANQGYWDRPVGLQAGDRYRPRVQTKQYDWFEAQLPQEGKYSFRKVLEGVGWI